MSRKLKLEGEFIARSGKEHAMVIKTDDYNVVISFKNWESLLLLLGKRKIKFRKTWGLLKYGKQLSQQIIIVVAGQVVVEIGNGKISKPKIKEFVRLYYLYRKGRRK